MILIIETHGFEQTWKCSSDFPGIIFATVCFPPKYIFFNEAINNLTLVTTFYFLKLEELVCYNYVFIDKKENTARTLVG